MDFSQLKFFASSNTEFKEDLFALFNFVTPDINKHFDIDFIIDYFKELYSSKSSDLNAFSSLNKHIDFFDQFFIKILKKHNLELLIQDVKNCDFMIFTEDKYIVGLRYNAHFDTAPRIICMGDYKSFDQLVSLAQHHNILFSECDDLASEMYHYLNLGDEISSKFYHRVADIMVTIDKFKF